MGYAHGNDNLAFEDAPSRSLSVPLISSNSNTTFGTLSRPPAPHKLHRHFRPELCLPHPFPLTPFPREAKAVGSTTT